MLILERVCMVRCGSCTDRLPRNEKMQPEEAPPPTTRRRPWPSRALGEVACLVLRRNLAIGAFKRGCIFVAKFVSSMGSEVMHEVIKPLASRTCSCSTLKLAHFSLCPHPSPSQDPAPCCPPPDDAPDTASGFQKTKMLLPVRESQVYSSVMQSPLYFSFVTQFSKLSSSFHAAKEGLPIFGQFR